MPSSPLLSGLGGILGLSRLAERGVVTDRGDWFNLANADAFDLFFLGEVLTLFGETAESTLNDVGDEIAARLAAIGFNFSN